MAQAIPMALMAGAQLFSGISQNKAAKAEARGLEESARREELGGELDAAAIARQQRAIAGESIVASAVNGVAVGSGSALDMLRQSAVEAEWDALSARYNAHMEADGLRRQAKQTRKAGKQALIGSVLGAGATVLSATTRSRNASAVAAAAERGRNAQLPGGIKLPDPYRTPPYVPIPSNRGF